MRRVLTVGLVTVAVTLGAGCLGSPQQNHVVASKTGTVNFTGAALDGEIISITDVTGGGSELVAATGVGAELPPDALLPNVSFHAWSVAVPLAGLNWTPSASHPGMDEAILRLLRTSSSGSYGISVGLEGEAYAPCVQASSAQYGGLSYVAVALGCVHDDPTLQGYEVRLLAPQ